MLHARQVLSSARIGESYCHVPETRFLAGHPCLSRHGLVHLVVWAADVKFASCGRVAAGLVPIGEILGIDY